MVRGLAVAVEIYDRNSKKWFTIEPRALEKGQIMKLKTKKILEEIRQGVIDQARNNGNESMSEDELEEEMEGLILDYFTFAIEKNHDLFAFLADIENDGKKRRLISNISRLRGPPLDTSVPHEYIDSSRLSFFTLSELEQITWDQRIDVPTNVVVDRYNRNYHTNYQGPILTISEKEWLSLDEEAKRVLSARNNLRITLNSIYLRTEDLDFLYILSYMIKASNTWKIDPYDMRMVLIFTQ